MTPNPEVWGAPETWLNTPSFPFTGANSALKCDNPKSANFGDNTCTLLKGDEAGKTLINHELDNTICPCGQDAAVSCFGKRDYYINIGEGASPHLVRTITENTPVNWFIFSGGEGAGLLIPDYNGGDYDEDYKRWEPNAVFNNNLHSILCPFVYWQIKSILLRIEVNCITEAYTNYPIRLQWRSLEDWKNSYSNEKITEIRFWFEGVNSSNTTTNKITYRYRTNASSKTLHGIGLLSNQVDAYNIRDILDYTAYNRNKNCCIDIIGSWLKGNYYRTDRTYIIMHKDEEKFPGIDDKSHVEVHTDHGFLYWYEIPYSVTAYESIKKMAACFGLPFTLGAETIFDADFLSDDIYLPIIDDEGITHGEYTNGAANANNPYLLKTSIFDYNYNPTGFDIYIGDKRVRKIYYRGQQIKTAYFANKKL